MAFRPERALDDVAWRILAALQEDARLSFSELGRRIGLSPPAAAERVRRLEEAGIITGYRAELNPERLGYPVSAIIRVTAPEERFARLRAAVAELEDVLEAHHVTGSDSLVLRVIAVSVGHLEQTIEQLGRHGTPTTAVILSSPVARRPIRGRSRSVGTPARTQLAPAPRAPSARRRG